MTTVLMMAGGTGGHIFPALAIADELAKRGVNIVWLGAHNGMETRIVPAHSYPIECISITGLRGKKLSTVFLIPWRLSVAIWQTMKIISRIKPDLAIGMGGFVTGPGGLVSWLMGKPLVIHEQNAISGLTNRLLSKLARRVLTAFPKVFPKQNTLLVGNPVRKDIADIAEPELRFASKLEQQELKILVVGGSLGALKLNEVVPETINLLCSRTPSTAAQRCYKQYHIRHQSGKNKSQALQDRLTEYGLKCDEVSENFDSSSMINYEVMEFIDDMAAAYSWADIIVCRAGALTISEISMIGAASILVPYPHAVDDHQCSLFK